MNVIWRCFCRSTTSYSQFAYMCWRNGSFKDLRCFPLSAGVKTVVTLQTNRSALMRHQRAFMISCKLNNTQKKYEDSNRLTTMVQVFERALFERMQKAGFKRSRLFYTVGTTLTMVILFAVGYLFLFPHKVRQQVVDEVSTVASKSLEDENIAIKAEQLSKDVVNNILNDDQTKTVASEFVKDIIMSKQTRDAAIDTILDLMNDPKVIHLLQQRLTEILLDILQNESTRQIVISQVNSILQHESVQVSLQHLLKELLNTAEVNTMMAEFFRDVLASDTVTFQGKMLGQQVTADVISSKEIQQQAGDALWSAVKFSMIPRYFHGNNTDDKKSMDSPEINKTAEKSSDSGYKTNRDSTPSKFEDEYIIIQSEGMERLNRYTVDDDNISD